MDADNKLFKKLVFAFFTLGAVSLTLYFQRDAVANLIYFIVHIPFLIKWLSS